MKVSSIITSLGLIGMVQSVDMDQYSAGAGVDAGFKGYVQELYRTTEDPAATTIFTDFFTTNGQLIVLGNTATGVDQITALKQALLPTAGNKHWNHRPNVTTVDSESSTQKIFNVFGKIETTFDGGNCSLAYYSTRFTVQKDASGSLAFATQSGNLVKYDDYVVQPAVAPTNIACGT